MTALTKSNATSAGDTLIQVGDKITFSWKENGNIVSKELTVAAAANTSNGEVKTLADVATVLNDVSGNLKVLWQAKADNGTDTFTSDDVVGTEDKKGDNVVLNSTTYEKLTAKEAGGTGIYAVAKKDIAITDFSVEVTYVNAKGETVNRTDAQEALKLNGVQQTHNQQKGSSDIGSHSVFSNNLYEGTTDTGIAGAKGDNTAFNELVVRGTSTLALSGDTAYLDITVNDRTYKVNASATIDDLNKMLEDDKMGVQVHLLNKGDTLKYGDTAVTRGVGDDATEFKATASGLYFVGADGVDIQKVSIATYKDDGTTASTGAIAKSFSSSAAALDGSDVTKGLFHSIQTRGDVPEPTEKNSSNPLTFFIGGEPNFGIEVTINKMDMKSLIGMDSDSFAKKFLTKEGAESALTMIDDAISKALNEQTKLGAIESRLGYASDNLTTMNTNMEETDSVLRDSDIAKDMVQFSKYSVLSQFAQAMLAQANNSGAGMLQFLQP